MKTITGVIAGLIAMLFSVMPVNAFGGYVRHGESVDQQAPYAQKVGKDECLLVAQNCGDETDTIQQRITRLNNEIRKGTAVYTPDELDVLKRQLKDEYGYLSDLNDPGDGHHHSMKHRR